MVLTVAGALVLAMVLILGILFSDFLGTRVVGFKGPRTSVRQGDKISLLMPSSVGVVGRKIEICRKNMFKVACTRLVFRVAPNAKTADVQVPLNYKLGSADLRMTGMLNSGQQVVLGVRGVVVMPYVSTNQNSGGSGGGNGGGGSSSNASSSDPTPPPPYSPYGG